MKRLNKIMSLLVILVSLFLVTACDKPISEQERILNELANLKLINYQEGNDENHVTKDITLTTSVLTYTIYWSSDHEAIQIKDNLGIVTQSEGDVQVNLTATVIVTADVFVEQEFLLVVRMWEHPYYCHINFDLDGGTLGFSAMDVKYGNKIENLADPVKEGYVFIKWVSNGVDYDFTKPVTSDLTLVAVWGKEPENYCNIILDANGGSLPTGSSDTHQILEGEVFSNPNITPTKEGYTFKGWYFNGELYDFTKPVTSDITLVAEYEEIIVFEYVNVIFDANGGSLPAGASDTYQIILGEVFDNPNITPTKEGYTFKGWYHNDVLFDFSNPIMDHVTLIAKWEELTDPIDPIDPNNQVVINNQNDPKVKSYYLGINFQSSANSLQSALRALISVNASSYDAAKVWLLEADRDMVNRDKLRGIYDQALFNRAWDGAATWNREHVWPQSKLGSAPKGEAHNLRVSGTRINSNRGNYPFGETSSSTGNLGYRIGDYWWPGDIDKGDVARITMYMNLRYGLYVTNNADITVLYKWHVEDPVDAFEIQRNNVIHAEQGNRNPFIDYPEIFAKLYQLIGGQIASAQIDTQTFIQTNITYNVNMTNINLSDLNRKSFII